MLFFTNNDKNREKNLIFQFFSFRRLSQVSLQTIKKEKNKNNNAVYEI